MCRSCAVMCMNPTGYDPYKIYDSPSFLPAVTLPKDVSALTEIICKYLFSECLFL
jgi:hypothetical protein